MKLLRNSRRAGFDVRALALRPGRALPLSLLLFFLMTASPGFARDPLHLAVLPMQPVNGRLTVQVAELDSILITKIQQREDVIPVAPERVRKIIDGRSCTDLPCQLELGNELGADRVLTVSGMYLGRALRLELRSVDIAAQRVDQLQTITFDENVDTLGVVFAEMADELLSALTARKVFLSVNTDPRGASIELNGVPKGIAPVLLEVDPSEPVQLAAQLGVMRTEGKVESFHKDTLNVLMVLQPSAVRRPGLFRGTEGHFYLLGGVTMIHMGVRYDQPPYLALMVEYGKQWRMSFGLFQNRQVISGIPASELDAINAVSEPTGNALGGFAMLVVAPPFHEKLSPQFGLGIAGIQRTVEMNFADGSHLESYEEFSMGGVIRFGVEYNILKNIRIGLLFQDMFLLDDSPVSNDFEGQQYDVWDEAFETFDSVTSLNLMVGIEF